MPIEPQRLRSLLRDNPRPGWAAGVVVALAVALFGALGVNASGASALTPTPEPPTPTPEPTLTWTIDVSPAGPVAGDDIKVTANASGEGGLPKYTLILEDDPALLELKSPQSVSLNQLGVPVSWELNTLAEGQAHFHIAVNYEREFCVPAGCFFAFTNENSPQVKVGIDAVPAVGGVVLDGNPAALPLYEAGSGSTSTTAVAMIGAGAAAALLAAGTVAWLLRRKIPR